MIWSERPSRYSGEGSPAFNLIKNLSKKHEIHLLFTNLDFEKREYPDLSQYCKTINFVNINSEESQLNKILKLLKNNINLFKKNQKFFSSIYHPEMEKKIKKKLNREKIDIIFTNCPTSPYVRNIDKPKVAHVMDCGSNASIKNFWNSKKYIDKLYWILSYFQYKWIERSVLTNFNRCVVISKGEYKALHNSSKKLNISIIPNGIDGNFFTPIKTKEQWPSIIFFGTMNHPPNVEAVLYFYSNIYINIKQKNPQIKFYVVGQKPAKELSPLKEDSSVIITGFVEDVRPFIAKSSVVIAPFISGTGVKNKVLEAMSMGKVVVSTLIGARGIDAINNEEIIIVDDPKEFANKIVNILSNPKLSKDIGYNARKKVLDIYSNESSTKSFESIFERVVKNG